MQGKNSVFFLLLILWNYAHVKVVCSIQSRYNFDNEK